MNKIKDYKIGKGITFLPGSVFRGNFIEKVVILDYVTKINNMDFANNSIKEIDLGKSLNYIGYSSFSNGGLSGNHSYPVQINYLKEVYIPSNVSTILGNVFSEVSSDVIIRTERTKENFLASVTTMANDGEYGWRGQAQVISSNGLIYL